MSHMLIKIKPAYTPSEISVHGIPGKMCKILSAPFENILGDKVVSSRSTAEMAQPVNSVGVSANVAAKN